MEPSRGAFWWSGPTRPTSSGGLREQWPSPRPAAHGPPSSPSLMVNGARRATFGSNPTRRWRTSSASATNRRFRRRKPSALSAEAIGAEFRCLDLGDYPLEVDRAALEQLVALIHEVEPDVILTHTAEDPFNPDHPVAHEAVKKARMLASGAGVQSGFKTIKPPVLYAFEP